MIATSVLLFMRNIPLLKPLLSNKKLIQGSQDYGSWTCIGWDKGHNLGVWLIPCGHIVMSGKLSSIDCFTCMKFYEINPEL